MYRGCFGLVLQHRAQIADGGLQNRLGEELVAPYRFEQCVLGEQGPGLPHERAQQRERRRRDGHIPSIAQQARVELVEFECIEADLQCMAGGSGIRCHVRSRALGHTVRDERRPGGGKGPLHSGSDAYAFGIGALRRRSGPP